MLKAQSICIAVFIKASLIKKRTPALQFILKQVDWLPRSNRDPTFEPSPKPIVGG